VSEALSSMPATTAQFDPAVVPSRTVEQQFRLALLLTVGICCVFGLGYWLERDVMHRHPGDIRFIREATEAGMRYITIPHIIIGFLFMVSSPKNRNRTRRLWVAALLLLGAVLCFGYYAGGAKTNVFMMMGVYFYFIVHEMRDEAMFYQTLGDAPDIRDRRAFNQLVRAWMFALLFATAAVLWFGVPLGVAYERTGWDPSAWPLVARSGMATGPFLVALGVIGLVLRRHARRLGYADADALLRAHAPMFRVTLGVLGVLMLSLILTQRAYSLILFHVAGWYLFAGYQFRRHPPHAEPRSLWLRMRTTFKGFRVLHVGMALVLMAIGLVWTLGLHQTPYLAWLLAPESFLYWTIMHITVSFVPR